MIREQAARLRAGSTSCVELTEQALEALKRDQLNAVITLMEDRALEAAVERDKELARGMDRGLFHGIPLAHKDLFYTRGVRTTAGSIPYRDFVPSYNATVIDKLEVAGAITIAKLNLHELAYGITSKNPHHGFVRNPHDPERIPGGSSGGSAALVAQHAIPMSLGTDTGGSIRIPASYCGVVGLKPTYGRVSRRGVLPLAAGLDHVGPIAASVEDCALAMNVIAGPDPKDESSAKIPAPEFNLPPLKSLAGIRIGLPSNFFFEQVQNEIGEAVRKAAREAERLGAEVEEVQVPEFQEVNLAARVMQLAEVAALYANHRDSSQFGQDVWALLEQGRMIAGHEYVNAQRLRTVFRREMDALWAKVDLLFTPTTPITAPRMDESTVDINGQPEDARMASTRLVRGLNFVGDPGFSIPCGRTAQGLPIGLQMISPPFTEPQLLQVARTLEPYLFTPAAG
ncbi:MAG TPA: amidase [Bryobacteraceae bacterium]|jgi:aspartyl-tRNA(Asn)/glutamyl-tRNA(Gln) amidotransferase subunit A|nr:amidase [Bryobacteraceae bacterium]